MKKWRGKGNEAQSFKKKYKRGVREIVFSGRVLRPKGFTLIFRGSTDGAPLVRFVLDGYDGFFTGRVFARNSSDLVAALLRRILPSEWSVVQYPMPFFADGVSLVAFRHAEPEDVDRIISNLDNYYVDFRDALRRLVGLAARDQ